MRTIIALSLLFLLSEPAFSQPIAQWRGSYRNGIYNETNLLKQWPAGGPALLWSLTGIGNGYGSPVIAQDKLYITGEKDSICWLYAMNLKGKEIWRADCGKEWVKSYPGSRSSPTVTEDLVYVCSGLGNLSCFETTTGKKKFTIDMIRDLRGQYTLFGHSESPVIDGDKIFLVPGGKYSNIVAINRFTKKVLWISSGNGDRSAYNSPLLIQLPARKILVTFTAYSLFGIDTETGKILWKHEQDNIHPDKREPGNGDTHSNTIFFEDGFIYYIAGDGNGAVKLELSPDGNHIKQIWRNKEIDNYMGGFVKIGKYIYSCVSEKKELVSIDTETGKISGSLKIGTGTIIFADGMIYYYNQQGVMNLVRPGNGKPELISKFKITAGAKEHFSHPVINDGVLYIRHGSALQAYDIKSN